MSRSKYFFLFGIIFLTTVSFTEAQQTKIHRVGVVMHGGPYYEAIQGLRDGLRKLGLQESKDFVLDIQDAKGDLRSWKSRRDSLNGKKSI